MQPGNEDIRTSFVHSRLCLTAVALLHQTNETGMFSALRLDFTLGCAYPAYPEMQLAIITNL